MERYQRDSDVVADALKQVRRVGREAARPTGTEINLVTERVDEVAVRVDEAKAAAERALAEVINAGVTSDGRNRIYLSESEPVAPDDGFAQGDQWAVQAGDRVSELRVWNGTGWVPLRMLADELIVVGEDGLVQLKDGVVTTEKLSADAIDGKTIRGVTIEGGNIELIDDFDYRETDLVAGQYVDAWRPGGDSDQIKADRGYLTLFSHVQGQAATAIFNAPPRSLPLTDFTFLTFTTEMSEGSFSDLKVTVNQIEALHLSEEEPVDGVVRVNIPASVYGAFVDTIKVEAVPELPVAWVRNIKIEQSSTYLSGAAMRRLPNGQAIIESTYLNTRTRLSKGGIDFDVRPDYADQRDDAFSDMTRLTPGGISSQGPYSIDTPELRLQKCEAIVAPALTATTEEVTAGTENAKYVTPATSRVIDSGHLTVPTGALTQVGSTGFWATTLDVYVPKQITPNKTLIKLSTLAVGSGFGNISQVDQVVDGTRTKCTIRFTQVGNAREQTIGLMWELIRID